VALLYSTLVAAKSGRICIAVVGVSGGVAILSMFRVNLTLTGGLRVKG